MKDLSSDKDKAIALLQTKLKERDAELDQLYRLLAKLNGYVENIIEDTQKGIGSAMSLHRKLATKKIPKWENMSFASRYIMSRSDLHSYFDVFPLHRSEGVAVVICEAKGYGVSSMLMSMVMALVDTPYANTPKGFMKTLMEDMKKHAKTEDFSVVYLVIEKNALNMKYCSLGMPGIFIIRGEERILLDPSLEEKKYRLKPGDRIMLFNNTVIQAKNDLMQDFGSKKLMQSFNDGQHMPVADLISNLGFELDVFIEGDKSRLIGDVVMLGVELERNILYIV